MAVDSAVTFPRGEPASTDALGVLGTSGDDAGSERLDSRLHRTTTIASAHSKTILKGSTFCTACILSHRGLAPRIAESASFVSREDISAGTLEIREDACAHQIREDACACAPKYSMNDEAFVWE
jgi:hypothetical protein